MNGPGACCTGVCRILDRPAFLSSEASLALALTKALRCEGRMSISLSAQSTMLAPRGVPVVLFAAVVVGISAALVFGITAGAQ